MKRVFRILASSLLLLTLILSFQSCEQSTEVGKPPSNGQANFTSFVAIGNSLTAGYQSNALFQSAQVYSFPALIAKQAGVTDFQQPLISDPGIGGRIRVTSLSPLTFTYDNPAGGQPTNINLQRPYNNLGIPGALLWIPNPSLAPISDLTDTSDFVTSPTRRGNPFFQIVLRNPALGKSILQQAAALHPTFVTLWIGNNDVLGYAATGGGWVNGNKILQPTPPQMFSSLYSAVAAALKQMNPNVQVVVANIPDVSAIPFFTTVPPYILNPQTNQPIIGDDGKPIHWLGVNDGDLVTLRALPLIQSGYGIPQILGGNNKPLPDSVVLDVNEQATVRGAITAYNSAIASVASQNGFALVDAYSIMNDLKRYGMLIAGQEFTAEFITGGFFSYDGVHPSSRGYAIVANEFLKVINQKWNANIPYVDVMSVPGEPLGKRPSVKGLPNIPKEVIDRTVELLLP